MSIKTVSTMTEHSRDKDLAQELELNLQTDYSPKIDEDIDLQNGICLVEKPTVLTFYLEPDQDTINDIKEKNSITFVVRDDTKKDDDKTEELKKFMSVNISEIKERLYLGDAYAANNKALLKAYGITHILICAAELTGKFDDFVYEKLNLHDKPEQNIIDVFGKSYDFIDKALSDKDKAVFIHCQAGISRSATIMAAYLIRKYKIYNVNETLKYISKLRPQIRPNSGFKHQLSLYLRALKKTT